MTNVTDFRDKAVQTAIQNVEAEILYAPLYEYELTDFALDAYEHFAKTIGMPESTHTRNAYLLQFCSILNRNGDSFPPEMIEEMLKSFLRETKMVTNLAPDYLKKLGHSGDTLDNLYAATIAAPASLDRPNTRNMSALIGEDAVKLMHADKYLIPENGLAFHDGAFSAEAKTFHMIQLAKHTSALVADCAREIEEKDEISEFDLKHISKFLDHLNNINPLPKKTPLEAKVFENMCALEEIHADQLTRRIHKIAPDRDDAPPFTMA